MARPKDGIDLKRNKDTGLWETWYSPPEKGARRKAERHGTADEIEANRKHAIFVEQLKRGLLKDRDVTFGMLAEDYFAWGEKNNRSPIVLGKRRRNWKTRLAPELAGVRVADIDGAWLDGFFDRMRRGEAAADFDVAGRSREALSGNTIASLQNLLGAILSHGAGEGNRLHHSLVPKIKKTKIAKSAPRAWSDFDAYTRIIEASKVDRRLHLFTAFGLYTGHRSNIVYRLPWRLVDFNARMIYCRQLKLEQRHDRDRKRVVDSAMNEALYAVLWQAWQTRPNPQSNGDDLVLGHGGDLGGDFRAMLAALGLPGSPHWMRHTFVTSLRRQGVGFDDIAIMTGDDPRTLAKTYAWVQTPDVRGLYGLLPGGAASPAPPAAPGTPAAGAPFLRRVK